MDDEIFAIEENIRGLKKDLENIKLENDYLSSAEKLMEFQYLYFPDELVKKELKEIIIINKQFDKSEAKPLSIINE